MAILPEATRSHTPAPLAISRRLAPKLFEVRKIQEIRMEVFGAGWSARINPNPRPIEVWDERAFWPMALEIRADATGAAGMMAEELRCFCRVVRGQQSVPVGATYGDALQVQHWMDRLASGLDRGQTTS